LRPNWSRGANSRLKPAKTPGLPLITRAGASEDEVAMLRTALNDLANDPAAAPLRAALGLKGFTVLAESAYDAVLELERDAVAMGYPALA